MEKKRCGSVAIIGHPNVGKSTLMNRLVGYKLSAIANKPQTTRTNIRGIVTKNPVQAVFTDTPGIHQSKHSLLNHALNREAIAALEQTDVVLMLVEALRWTTEDDLVISHLQTLKNPVFLLVNKVDRILDKQRLLIFIERLKSKYHFAEIFPLSATKGINIDIFWQCLSRYLPESEFIYPEDQITDQSLRFISAELIREQLVVFLHQELPYDTAVDIERFAEKKKRVDINAVIWVNRKGQKGIVIGRKGETLKRIGTAARLSLENFLNKKVMLKLWVRVEENWQNNPRSLKELGITTS